MGVDAQTQQDITIGGLKLEAVQGFKIYRVKDNYRWTFGIGDQISHCLCNRHTGKAKSLRPMWQNITLSIKSKVRLLRAIVISTTLYCHVPPSRRYAA